MDWGELQGGDKQFGVLVHIVAAIAWLCSVGLLAFALPMSGATPGPRAFDSWVAIVVCGFPWLLCIGVGWLARKGRARISQIALTPSLTEAHGRTAVKLAETNWEYEKVRNAHVQEKLLAYASLLGLSTTMSLSLCAYLLLCTCCGTSSSNIAGCSPNSVCNLPALIVPASGKYAVAIGVASLGSFLHSMAAMVHRTALHDASERVVAVALRNLLKAMIAAAGLIAVGRMTGVTMFGSHLLAAGLAAAVFGDEVLVYLAKRFRNAIGSTERAPASISLVDLDGLSKADAERLEEEGVTSVHALAYLPTARLFFATRYGLPAICDWQDQALLHCFVGSERAKIMREQLQVRGATDAQRLIHTSFASPPAALAPDAPGTASNAKQPEVLAHLLGFQTVEHARLALEDLMKSDVIGQLAVYRSSAPSLVSHATTQTPQSAAVA